jgi:hypothetical protein
MGLAKDERALVAEGKGCLGKAADDEPVFVLRAQDKFFIPVVKMWSTLVWTEICHGASRKALDYDQKGLEETVLSSEDVEGLIEVGKILQLARLWQAANITKVKLPD